jgi:DNA-binding MarR family transcriptional regulator
MKLAALAAEMRFSGILVLKCVEARAILDTSRCGNNNKRVRVIKDMLDVFITSRVRRKIIVIYAKYPDFKTHVRGLAKLIKEDAGNIQRELKRLEKAGFLISEKQGNTKIYHTNKQFVIFKELQSIVLKSQRTQQQKRQVS